MRTGINVLTLTFLLVLMAPAPSVAVTCHCFRDRTFVPENPESADPYVLATTRNSLAAAAAGIDKSAVVRQRMKGATENDLWLDGYLPARLGTPPGTVRAVRQSGGGWPEVFRSLGKDPGALGEEFAAAVAARDETAMAGALADTVIARAFGGPPGSLPALRKAGANIAERTLSVLVSGMTGREPAAVYESVRAGQDTWGSLLHAQGIRLDQVGDVVMQKVQRIR